MAPLAAVEQEQYYRESLQMVRLLGLLPEHCPPTWAACQTYLHTMLSSDQLAVTPAARDLAALVLHPSSSPIVWPLFAVTAQITNGLLPARLRAEYGYHWGKSQQRLFDLWVSGTRWTLPHLPTWLREFPEARAAEQRVAHTLRAKGARQGSVPAGR